MKNSVNTLELNKEHLEAMAASAEETKVEQHQLMREQLQLLSDQQRELREQLTQIQQQKKPTMTSNTSKSIQQISSCSSSSEHEQAQKVIKKYVSK